MLATSLMKELSAGCCNESVTEQINLHCTAVNNFGVCVCLEEGNDLTISVGMSSSIVI
jgi:hypothetical protein